MHRFRDTTYLNRRDLKRSPCKVTCDLVCPDMVYICFFIPSGVQNELSFALRCTVCEIQTILTCMTLRWPWKVTQGYISSTLHTVDRQYTYPSYAQEGLRFSLILLYNANRFRGIDQFQFPHFKPWCDSLKNSTCDLFRQKYGLNLLLIRQKKPTMPAYFWLYGRAPFV